MPITRITIRKADHSETDITEAFQLRMGQDTPTGGHYERDVLKVTGNSVTLDMPALNVDVVEQAIAEVAGRGAGWLRSINHVKADNGQVLMSGDACFSWVPEMDSIRTYVDKTSGPNNTETVRSYLAEKGGGIRILNMCAACGSCQPQAALRVMLENLKLKLNEMKDKNLYDNANATARRGVLRSQTMAPDASCGIPIRIWPADTVASNMLLGQYATCVHMWNYIAARAYSQTLVEPAAQDASAILVRSKHAFPACLPASADPASAGTVKCTIDIRRYNSVSNTNDDISVYVPPPDTEFKPFGNNAVGAHDATITHDMSDASHKTITTSTWPAVKAGTYCVAFYFMPFNYAELTDQTGNVLQPDYVIIAPPDPDAAYHPYVTQTTVVDPSDGVAYPATQYSHGRATFARLVKYNTSDTGQSPTGEDMYNKCKSYPSRVNRGVSYTWQLRVTWTTTGLESVNGSTSTPVDHYTDMLISLPAPRTPLLELLPSAGDTTGNRLFTDITLYNVSPRDST